MCSRCHGELHNSRGKVANSKGWLESKKRIKQGGLQGVSSIPQALVSLLLPRGRKKQHMTTYQSLPMHAVLCQSDPFLTFRIQLKTNKQKIKQLKLIKLGLSKAKEEKWRGWVADRIANSGWEMAQVMCLCKNILISQCRELKLDQNICFPFCTCVVIFTTSHIFIFFTSMKQTVDLDISDTLSLLKQIKGLSGKIRNARFCLRWLQRSFSVWLTAAGRLPECYTLKNKRPK